MGDDIVGTHEGDRFGFAVAIDGRGRRLAIAAMNETSTGGVVRAYEWNEDAEVWARLG